MKRLVSVAVAVGLGVSGLGVADAAGASAATSYKAPQPVWHTCSADFIATVAANYDPISPVPVSTRIKCADLTVPLDYAHPNGTKITLALTLTPHTGTGKAKGDELVNPGGPGGGGALFGARVFAQNSVAMQSAYNVIGFDPRGVGDSKPALSCDTDYNDAPRPYYGTGGRQLDAIWLQRSAGYAAACEKADTIGLLNHIHTTDSVRDMDTIRAALGDRKLDYYGASYGSYLGSVYATMFPKKVGRMVLDGNVDPSGVWYGDNLDQDYAFNTDLEYYFGWIAKYDSVYHLGTTQKAVHDYYYATLKNLVKHPIYGTSGGTSVAVGPDELTDNIQTAAYRRSQFYWNLYAAGLSALKSGDTQTFLDTFSFPTSGPQDDNEFAVYNAVQCTDTQWPQSFAKWHADNVRVNKQAPFLTWGNVWFNAPCLYWPAPAASPVKVGATPDLPKNILMFNATADAATPIDGALNLHKILRGSHMIIQDGDRTHCIVHRADPVVDAYYDDYFLHGTLPSQYTVHVPQLGDPVPPAQATATAKALVKSSARTTLDADVIK